jgi:DNA-binding NtrC family response regulator
MKTTHILLVDDEVGFVETMRKRLTKRGLTVKIALSGTEALDRLAEETKIEVVVLDVKMPVMDGLEALREIKTRFPLTEVLMLTGHATIADAINGMKLGAFDYLMKPCDMDRLMAKVDEAAAKRRQHEEKIAAARIHEITLRRA